MMNTRPQLYAHPFSSYCQKVLIALYENGTPFEYRNLEDETAKAELNALWSIGKFPLLRDRNCTIIEASCIIEHLDLYHRGPRPMLPDTAKTALQTRMLDRFFDNYLSTPQQKIVADSLRPPGARDAHGVAEAKTLLERAYAWLDQHMEGRQWAAGDDFTLADCGAAPFLFYADWTHRINPQFGRVLAYRRRLLQRPSIVRAVEEARPYRHYFPLGAPDRD